MVPKMFDLRIVFHQHRWVKSTYKRFHPVSFLIDLSGAGVRAGQLHDHGTFLDVGRRVPVLRRRDLESRYGKTPCITVTCVPRLRGGGTLHFDEIVQSS